jgi:cellulose biosynthesis protein BcsQ
MTRLDLILNGKGGVGKRFFAVNFVQFLKDKGIAYVAIDSDNDNSTLKRFHPDTRFLDLDNRREIDGISTALEKADLVVVDCCTASTELFIDYFTEIDLPAVLSAMGAALTLIMPVNHEADSVDQIQRLADQLGNAATSWSSMPRTATAMRCSSQKCEPNSRTSSADGKLPCPACKIVWSKRSTRKTWQIVKATSGWA